MNSLNETVAGLLLKGTELRYEPLLPALVVGIVGDLEACPEQSAACVRELGRWLREGAGYHPHRLLGTGLDLQSTPILIVGAPLGCYSKLLEETITCQGGAVRKVVFPQAGPGSVDANADALLAQCDLLVEIDPQRSARTAGAGQCTIPAGIAATTGLHEHRVVVQLRSVTEECVEPGKPNIAVAMELCTRVVGSAEREGPLTAADTLLEQLRNSAANLERLNRELPAQSPTAKTKEAGALEAHLPAKPPRPYQPTVFAREMYHRVLNVFRKPPSQPAKDKNALPKNWPLPSLGMLAGARRRFADLNLVYDGRVKSLIFRLFVFTFVIVLLLQISEYWLPPSTSRATGIDTWRIALFVVSLSLLAWGWRLWHRARREREFDRQNDYRALAEAMRVQFYWSAAGTGHSVGTDYPQRVYGELSWIRGAVRSLNLSCAAVDHYFAHANADDQLSLFERIGWGWLEEQHKYYSRRVWEFRVRRRRLNLVANVLLWAGFALVVITFVLSQHDAAINLWPGWNVTGQFLLGVWMGSVLAVAVVIQYIAWRAWPKSTAERSSNPSPADWQRRLEAWHCWLDAGWTQCGLGISAGVVLAAAVFSVAWPAWCPTALPLLLFSKKLTLTSGGLVHAWRVLKFLGENIRRYDASADLFSGVIRRYWELLQQWRQARDSADQARLQQLTKELQELLVSVGKEALAENADWLVMHRDRPIKPTLPGG